MTDYNEDDLGLSPDKPMSLREVIVFSMQTHDPDYTGGLADAPLRMGLTKHQLDYCLRTGRAPYHALRRLWNGTGRSVKWSVFEAFAK